MKFSNEQKDSAENSFKHSKYFKYGAFLKEISTRFVDSFDNVIFFGTTWLSFKRNGKWEERTPLNHEIIIPITSNVEQVCRDYVESIIASYAFCDNITLYLRKSWDLTEHAPGELKFSARFSIEF